MSILYKENAFDDMLKDYFKKSYEEISNFLNVKFETNNFRIFIFYTENINHDFHNGN